MVPTAPPLLARGLHKRYGDTHALDGFDLTVAPGTIHALLGPNGAGKTTAVHTFATLTRCDAGEVNVAGHDVRREGAAVRRQIGLVGQTTALDEVLFGDENLVMLGRLHGMTKAQAQVRADELIATFGLDGAGGRKVSTYSGGMRRRLDIAASLIRRPSLLFLDEPTSGLDPRGRLEVWETVRRVVELGTTVLLTTQYLDEADQLSDRITVMGAGRVIAEGTSSELKSRLGGDRVIVTASPGTDLGSLADSPRRKRRRGHPRDHRRGRSGRRDGGPARRRTHPRPHRDRGRRRAAAPAHPRRGLPAPDRHTATTTTGDPR